MGYLRQLEEITPWLIFLCCLLLIYRVSLYIKVKKITGVDVTKYFYFVDICLIKYMASRIFKRFHYTHVFIRNIMCGVLHVYVNGVCSY